MSKSTENIPKQTQKAPGSQEKMMPEPEIIKNSYKGSDKLKGKVAVITGGDSGIGRSVAVHFAREGADVVVIYLKEHQDAQKTRELVEKEGRECKLIAGDIGDKNFCRDAIRQTIDEFGKVNILVNNAGEQHPEKGLEDIDLDVMEKTFRTNIFSIFYLTKEVLKHMQKGDVILNNASVTAYRGSEQLIDYSSTKGAITSFTRSLGKNLAPKGIRVNGVAPGPIWTPLIPSTFDEEKVASFGKNVPLGRAGHPSEVAPAFVFLASDDASYITCQIIHPNGGEVVNS